MKKFMMLLAAVLSAGIAMAAMTEQEIGKKYAAAREMIKKGKVAESRAIVVGLIAESQADNTKRDMHIFLAKSYLEENKLEDAAREIATAKTLNRAVHPNTMAGTDIIEGRLLILRKDYEGAAKAFDRVLKPKHHHPLFKSEAQFYLAESLLAQGKKAEALEAFKAVQTYPQQWGEVKKMTADRIAELSK